jgi:pantoate--beta-alanine ligase
MEGATRPGHFNGVAQVVSRLFALVNPQRAYFGEKDFQQIAVIKAMVAQLAIEVDIVECAIVRGEDGLALSSRNELLTSEHRKAAPHIYATISQCAAKMESMTPSELTAWVVETIDSNPLLKTIYFEAVDAKTMQKVEAWSDSERIQGCCAVQAGDIRLIDNIRIK